MSENSHTIAIFGGSFNPPHLAHVLATAIVLSTEPIDRVLVVPAFRHPFAKPLASFDDRIAMSKLAMGWLPGVEISRIEKDLGGESRTLRTLERLRDQNPASKFRLIMGSDLLGEADRWQGFDAIRAIAPPLVLARVGAEQGGPPSLLPPISSTEVRAHIARGEWDFVHSLIPRKVLEYIRARGLYRHRDEDSG